MDVKQGPGTLSLGKGPVVNTGEILHRDEKSEDTVATYRQSQTGTFSRVVQGNVGVTSRRSGDEETDNSPTAAFASISNSTKFVMVNEQVYNMDIKHF